MPPPPGLNRVAVVEDHVLFAEALEIALTLHGYSVQRVSPSDQGASEADLLEQVFRAAPRTVLLDLDLGRAGDGTAMVEPLTRAGIAVLVITASMDRSHWGECLRSGALAVLPKGTPLKSILDAIRLVEMGRSVTSREQREDLIGHFQVEQAEIADLRRKLDLLTARERHVLGNLMSGRDVRTIARTSFVSESTVRSQVKTILAKLEVSSQLAAVGLAHRAAWVPPSHPNPEH